MQTNAEGLTTLAHPDGAPRFQTRWDFLHALDGARTNGALGKASMDMNDFYEQSKALMDTPASTRSSPSATRSGPATARRRSVNR